MRVFLLVLLLFTGSLAQPPAFVRIHQKPDALQVAITRYTLPKGVTVDLVGVVHVGEKDYYAALDKRLKGYDAVLFESILDEGNHFTSRREAAEAIGLDYEPHIQMQTDPNDPLTRSQIELCKTLGLEYQSTTMNYDGDNFVHADMTANQFAKAQEKAGPAKDFFALFQRHLKDAGPVKDRMALRRIMAGHLGDFESDDPIIITARNQVALAVLGKTLKRGKKKIAILYGAAHMPDFDRHLRKDFKAHLDGQNWLTAWKLK